MAAAPKPNTPARGGRRKPKADDAKADGDKPTGQKTTEGKELTASELATLNAYAEHQKIRAADSTVPVDVDLLKRVKKIKPGYELTPDEQKALDAAEKDEKDKPRAARKGKENGFRAAAEQVLREADGPMHNKDITKAVIDKKLTETTGGKKPHESMYVQLHQGVRRGIFVKVGPSIFDLKELNPKGAKTRPPAK